MGIKRGIDFYSYQQAQFFKELDLEGMFKEAASNEGVTGIELLDEQSLPYPDPSDEFVNKWFEMCRKYQLEPVTMDVFCDVLQFRDHVMSFEECAERLKHDIQLAKKLGFKNVRTLATTNIEILELALPTAEECDIRIAKEIHAPIPSVNAVMADKDDMMQRQAYNASKAGVVGLTKAMATAYAKYGITVNAVDPGLFPIEMTEPLFEQDSFIKAHSQMNPSGRPARAKKIAMKMLRNVYL